MTAQDQQSRAELLPCPFCGGAPETTGPWEIGVSDNYETCICCEKCGFHISSDDGFASGEKQSLAKAIDRWNRRAPAEQAARALPAGMEPFGYWHQGPTDDESDFHLHADQGDVSCKKCITLYTAAQVQAMGRVPPEWQAVPVEPSGDMLVAIMSAGEVDVLRETPEKHQVLLIDRAGIPERYANLLAAAPQPPAAPATTEPQAPTTGAGSVTAGAAQQLIIGPCGQCKDDRDPCSCAIDTMLKERGQIAVNRERHLAMAKQAKAAQERKPLTEEQIQDLIGFGDPTEQECHLVRLGWDAAQSIEAPR